MEAQRSHSPGGRTEPWIALVLCVAVFVAGVVQLVVPGRPMYAERFAPEWLPLVAAGFAAAAIAAGLRGHPQWPRLQGALLWSGLLLMVWTANGLPLDLMRVLGLAPHEVDWLGLVARALALAAAAMLARLALRSPSSPASARTVAWYGYAAFALALPYPVLRTCWALGGTLGLAWSGAAGRGFAPWLASIPWLLAAALSLLLVWTPRWMPPRLLLVAGWSATAVVAMIGPAACWVLISTLAVGGDLGLEGIAAWVAGLFYGSWFLWAVAAGAATRSYQVRSMARSAVAFGDAIDVTSPPASAPTRDAGPALPHRLLHHPFSQ